MTGGRGFTLALGGGGARGLAHIGVLHALEGAGLAPSAIAGTSIGAIVGAFYAAGPVTRAELESAGAGIGMRDILDMVDPSFGGEGIVRGDRVADTLAALLPSTFEELEIPFACVSTDVVSGEAVVHTTGDLVGAVHASMAIPSLFEPVRVGEQLLCDGGCVEPLPVRTARCLGPEVVVGVDVSGFFGSAIDAASGAASGGLERLRALPGMRMLGVGLVAIQIMQIHLARSVMGEADVLLRPAVSDYGMFDFAHAADIVEAGRLAATGELETLSALLAAQSAGAV